MGFDMNTRNESRTSQVADLTLNIIHRPRRIFTRLLSFYLLPGILVLLYIGSIGGRNSRPAYEIWDLPQVYYVLSWILIALIALLISFLFKYIPKDGLILFTAEGIELKDGRHKQEFKIVNLSALKLNIRPAKMIARGYSHNNILEIESTSTSLKLEIQIQNLKEREALESLFTEWQAQNPKVQRAWAY